MMTTSDERRGPEFHDSNDDEETAMVTAIDCLRWWLPMSPMKETRTKGLRGRERGDI